MVDWIGTQSRSNHDLKENEKRNKVDNFSLICVCVCNMFDMHESCYLRVIGTNLEFLIGPHKPKLKTWLFTFDRINAECSINSFDHFKFLPRNACNIFRFTVQINSSYVLVWQVRHLRGHWQKTRFCKHESLWWKLFHFTKKNGKSLLWKLQS